MDVCVKYVCCFLIQSIVFFDSDELNHNKQSNCYWRMKAPLFNEFVTPETVLVQRELDKWLCNLSE